MTLSQCLTSGGLSPLTYKAGVMVTAGPTSLFTSPSWDQLYQASQAGQASESLQQVLVGWLVGWSITFQRISHLRAQKYSYPPPLPKDFDRQPVLMTVSSGPPCTQRTLEIVVE